MGIEIKNTLAILPQGTEDAVCETTIYIEKDKIAGIGDKPAGFTADKVIDGKDKLVIPGLINCHTANDRRGYLLGCESCHYRDDEKRHHLL